MKRWLSITAICALLASPALPLVAAGCPHSAMTKACHRVQHAHHCEMMQEEASTSADPDSESPAIENDMTPQDCPMECCTPGQRTSAAAIVGIPTSSPAFLSEQALQFTPSVFVASGFSSHTDRGPPTA